MVQMLPRQLHPAIDLLGAATRLNVGAQTQRSGVTRVDLQNLLHLLERQLILVVFQPALGALHQLHEGPFPHGLVQPVAQAANGGMELALFFQLGEDFVGELKLLASERLLYFLNARLHLIGAEALERLVAQGLLQAV